MKPRTALPWISLLLIVVAVISPLGREILSNLFSNESLSRYMAQFLTMVYLGGLLALAIVEFAIRVLLMRRRDARRRHERVSD